MFTRSLTLAALFFCAAPLASASTLALSVSGPQDDAESAGAFVANKAFGTEFTTQTEITDISIAFDLECFSGCAGELVLVADTPGPSIPFDAFRGRQFFDFTGSGVKSLTGIFDGVDLLADTTYALVVAVEQGGALWYQSTSPTRVEHGITDGRDFTAATLSDQASYLSPFAFQPLDGSSFHIQITGTVAQPAVVPLPASGLLLAGGLAGVALVRRRRSIPTT